MSLASYSVSIDNLDKLSEEDCQRSEEEAIKKQLSCEILGRGPSTSPHGGVSRSMQLTLLRQIACAN